MACAGCQRKSAKPKAAAQPLDPADAFKGFRVVLLNLKERTDRLTNFNLLRQQRGWCFPEPQVFEAIKGNKVGVPSWFKQGGGAYGCWRSHSAILERAIMDGVPGVVVFEDDTDWDDDMVAALGAFMANVPSDWEALWLGGHQTAGPYDAAKGARRKGQKSATVAPGVRRVYSFERTHAYVVRGERAMKLLYQTWAQNEVHCDWLLGHFQEKANVYAPEVPMFCQCKGKSDINGRANPRKCWRPRKGELPVVLLKAPKEVAQALDAFGFHRGYDRDRASDIDKGLLETFKARTERERIEGLRKFIGEVTYECGEAYEDMVCTVWHPDATLSLIKRATKAEVREIVADSVEAALEAYPMEQLRESKRQQTPANTVALLRWGMPKEVVSKLRGYGFHTGNWRDAQSDVDRGLIDAMNAPAERRVEKLRQVYAHWLKPEAAKIAGGVVALWHEALTPELVEEATGATVVVIDAQTVEQAIEQWRAEGEGSK